MSTTDFIEARLSALKYFFKAKFGWHWHRAVCRELGAKNRLNALHYQQRTPGKLSTVVKLEALAVKHGFNTRSRLSLLHRLPDSVGLHSSELDARPRRY